MANSISGNLPVFKADPMEPDYAYLHGRPYGSYIGEKNLPVITGIAYGGYLIDGELSVIDASGNLSAKIDIIANISDNIPIIKDGYLNRGAYLNSEISLITNGLLSGNITLSSELNNNLPVISGMIEAYSEIIGNISGDYNLRIIRGYMQSGISSTSGNISGNLVVISGNISGITGISGNIMDCKGWPIIIGSLDEILENNGNIYDILCVLDKCGKISIFNSEERILVHSRGEVR